MIWQEFWHGKNQKENHYEPPLFKEKKTNLPKKHKTPHGLKTFLGALKSQILDHKNRNKVNCNLPKEELQALGELIKLQRDRLITIKPCDKGAGLIILNFCDYMTVCYTHLEATQNSKPQYSKVNDDAFDKAKGDINMLLEEGLDHEYLTSNEFKAMKPEEKSP